MSKKVLPGVRCDDYVDVPVDFTNPVVNRWIHKQVVKITGETEDDFILEEKPVLVESIDIQKEINAAAKGADLKSMIIQVLRTGDDSILNQREAEYADITNAPIDAMSAHNLLIQGQETLDNLNPALKAKGLDSILHMTKEDIETFVKDIIKKSKSSDLVEDKNVNTTTESEVK